MQHRIDFNKKQNSQVNSIFYEYLTFDIAVEYILNNNFHPLYNEMQDDSYEIDGFCECYEEVSFVQILQKHKEYLSSISVEANIYETIIQENTVVGVGGKLIYEVSLRLDKLIEEIDKAIIDKKIREISTANGMNEFFIIFVVDGEGVQENRRTEIRQRLYNIISNSNDCCKGLALLYINLSQLLFSQFTISDVNITSIRGLKSQLNKKNEEAVKYKKRAEALFEDVVNAETKYEMEMEE
jgi:hypothetical protein